MHYLLIKTAISKIRVFRIATKAAHNSQQAPLQIVILVSPSEDHSLSRGARPAFESRRTRLPVDSWVAILFNYIRNSRIRTRRLFRCFCSCLAFPRAVAPQTFHAKAIWRRSRTSPTTTSSRWTTRTIRRKDPPKRSGLRRPRTR